jgi:hypothetical protein
MSILLLGMRNLARSAAFLLLLAPGFAHAYAPITYHYKHFIFTLDPDNFPAWRAPHDEWLMNGTPIEPQPEWRVDGDSMPPLPLGVERRSSAAWNTDAIAATVRSRIAARFDRAPGSVTISRGSGGNIAFDGVGLPGRAVDSRGAALLTISAITEGVNDVMLPVAETQPTITVLDPQLAEQGIREVVTVGESDFSNSPANRRHNIRVGLSKFNGHLIPRGSVFSFGKTIGPVNGAAGFLRELVIKGDRTEPDYGGGLCQVSTTAYRGVWEYGFPILARTNHSFAVSHYLPQGTDATVYPPDPDMQFLNDSPGAIVIQTYAEGDLAYFIYYGTKDARTSTVIGPFIWGRIGPPPDKTVYTTTELAPGERKKLGERVPGMKAAWIRTTLLTDGTKKVEPVYSSYQARPLFYEVGVETLPEPTVPAIPEPDWVAP